MWKSISHWMPGFGPTKRIGKLSRASHDFSDDENSSNTTLDEGPECPICWESFNIVENAPYVLWCDHTICKTCVLALRWASPKFSNKHLWVPFFVSCPWCNSLTFRLVYKGNLRFPSKNFFLLWMVESRHGNRMPSLSFSRDHIQGLRWASVVGNYSYSTTNRMMHHPGHSSTRNNSSHHIDSLTSGRIHISLLASLGFLIQMTGKFLLLSLLLLVIFAVPTTIAILMLYMMITILFALPAVMLLYFSVSALHRLQREIRTRAISLMLFFGCCGTETH